MDYKLIVKEVERKDNKEVLSVVIENGPFEMRFCRKRNRVSIVSFARFDGSQDEAIWIPNLYFLPAIKIARGIFFPHKNHKNKKTFQKTFNKT